MNPLIGIASSISSATSSTLSRANVRAKNRNIVDGTYIDFVVKAGGIPVLIPHFDSLELMDTLLTRLDGIILAGGLDVNPQTYGQRIKGYCQNLVPSHDEEELCLARKAYAAGKCILGICRGAQILNVAMGGTLYQDLEKEGNFENHALYQVSAVFPTHKIRCQEGSLLYSILGGEQEVNSFHHQAVKDPGQSVTITAYSEDGVPEGIEVCGGAPFVAGVQWHPEEMTGSEAQMSLFRKFIEACQNNF